MIPFLRPHGSFPRWGLGWGPTRLQIRLTPVPQSAFYGQAQARQTTGIRPSLAPIPAFPQKWKEEE